MKTKKTKEKKIIEEQKEEVAQDSFVEVNVNSIVEKFNGVSILEALKAFVGNPKFPIGAKTKLIMRYGNQDKERMRIFGTGEARRLLMTMRIKPVSVDVLAAQFERSLS